MKSNLITPPALEPITLDEAKLHLRVETDLDDQLIEALIESARVTVETITNRALISQTWEHTFDCFPGTGELELQAGVSAINSVKYKDTDNVEQTLSAAVYELTKSSVPAVRLAYLQEWPSTLDHPESITVEVVAGYGATSADVPASIRQAMLLLIGHWYENREAVAVGVSMGEVPLAIDLLLNSHKVPYL